MISSVLNNFKTLFFIKLALYSNKSWEVYLDKALENERKQVKKILAERHSLYRF